MPASAKATATHKSSIIVINFFIATSREYELLILVDSLVVYIAMVMPDCNALN